jgi:uncharacterized membrane protein YfcA
VREVELFAISVAVGALGGMLGVGGGVFLIPILTLLLHIPIKIAIGASLVSVIATSSAAGAAYVGHGVTHSRLAMVLEIATAAGALAGGLLASMVPNRALEAGFAILLVGTSWAMGRLQVERVAYEKTGVLDTSYVDPASGRIIEYGVHRLPSGLASSFAAGGFSGLLGIGGGVIKVPMMALVMRIPLRAAIATSNFMIGVTASTSALVYFGRGYLVPEVTVPTALGILAGAGLEPRLFGKVRSAFIKRAFQGLLVFFALEMAYKAYRG